jgi:sucrose-6-phosphate hydrolase SacC (GH32 family)
MMLWTKRGQIFEFESSPFAAEFTSHAQSPQAVVFSNSVRIYFSTRKRSPNGKFVSHVRFVDFDKSLKHQLRYSDREVVALGAPGTFDEHGIFPFSPVQVGDKIFGYTTGWTRRKSVDVDAGIGLAISEDGGWTFQKIGDGPVLTSSLHEPFLVGDGFVRMYEKMFHMYYIYGTEWQQQATGAMPERTYVIGHAWSKDGIQWEKEGHQIIPSAYKGECQALPTVLLIGKRYHMFFCCRRSVDFRTNPKNGYRLGYAYSDDLAHWVRDDEAAGLSLSSEGWDSEMICYPHVFQCNETIYLLYNGNEFGRNGFGLAQLTV